MSAYAQTKVSYEKGNGSSTRTIRRCDVCGQTAHYREEILGHPTALLCRTHADEARHVWSISVTEPPVTTREQNAA